MAKLEVEAQILSEWQPICVNFGDDVPDDDTLKDFAKRGGSAFPIIQIGNIVLTPNDIMYFNLHIGQRSKLPCGRLVINDERERFVDVNFMSADTKINIFIGSSVVDEKPMKLQCVARMADSQQGALSIDFILALPLELITIYSGTVQNMLNGFAEKSGLGVFCNDTALLNERYPRNFVFMPVEDFITEFMEVLGVDTWFIDGYSRLCILDEIQTINDYKMPTCAVRLDDGEAIDEQNVVYDNQSSDAEPNQFRFRTYSYNFVQSNAVPKERETQAAVVEFDKSAEVDVSKVQVYEDDFITPRVQNSLDWIKFDKAYDPFLVVGSVHSINLYGGVKMQGMAPTKPNTEGSPAVQYFIADLSGKYLLAQCKYEYRQQTQHIICTCCWCRPSDTDQSAAANRDISSAATQLENTSIADLDNAVAGDGAAGKICAFIGDSWFSGAGTRKACRSGMSARGGTALTGDSYSKGGIMASNTFVENAIATAKNNGATDIVIHLGINGYYDPTNATEKPLKELKEATEGLNVHILTTVTVNHPEIAKAQGRVNAAIKSAASANGWHVVDMNDKNYKPYIDKYKESDPRNTGYHMTGAAAYGIWVDDFLTKIFGGTATAAPGKASEKEQKLYDYMVGQGWPGCQAAAIVGVCKQESGLNPNDVVTDTNGRTSGGICMWNGDNFAELKNKAAKEGVSWNNYDFQVRQAHLHFQNRASSRFKSATTLSDACAAAMDAQRPLLYDASLCGREGKGYANAKAKRSSIYKTKPSATSHSLSQLKQTAYYQYVFKKAQPVAKANGVTLS